nr:hypothetical protein [Sicyoidochytrium minutum DNA virus]
MALMTNELRLPLVYGIFLFSFLSANHECVSSEQVVGRLE